jgi:hypothetical protein
VVGHAHIGVLAFAGVTALGGYISSCPGSPDAPCTVDSWRTSSTGSY